MTNRIYTPLTMQKFIYTLKRKPKFYWKGFSADDTVTLSLGSKNDIQHALYSVREQQYSLKTIGKTADIAIPFFTEQLKRCEYFKNIFDSS